MRAKALAYEHIPWGVVLDENVDQAVLTQFPVVILPNAAIISDREVALLRDYVKDGGNLIVTGWSGLFGRYGKPGEGSRISKFIGAKALRRLDSLDNWISFPENDPNKKAMKAVRGSTRCNRPLLVKGPAFVYKPVTALPYGRVSSPHRTTRQNQGKEGTDWPMSPDKPVGPALIEDVPLYRAAVVFEQPVKKVTALNSKTEIKHKGRTVELQIEAIHETILVSYRRCRRGDVICRALFSVCEAVRGHRADSRLTSHATVSGMFCLRCTRGWEAPLLRHGRQAERAEAPCRAICPNMHNCRNSSRELLGYAAAYYRDSCCRCCQRERRIYSSVRERYHRASGTRSLLWKQAKVQDR